MESSKELKPNKKEQTIYSAWGFMESSKELKPNKKEQTIYSAWGFMESSKELKPNKKRAKDLQCLRIYKVI